jgi:predicted transcriptional regulator
MVVRAHVVLPEELLAEVDRLAGKRKRSRFVEEAVREKLTLERQRKALRESAGILNAADYPEWQTPEMISEWVRNLRQLDNERLERKLAALRDEGAEVSVEEGDPRAAGEHR